MAEQKYKFEGWLGLDKEAANGKMVWQEFEPKRWEETDVDIKISHCGICGSDLHTLRSGWGPTEYPVCVGHEIIGTVVRLGSQAGPDLKLGSRVGVGAQSDSCRGRVGGPCPECDRGEEQYCQRKFVPTYNGRHLNGDKSQGGYALYARVPGYFAIPVPDTLPSEHAAPMMCAGTTTYAPLKRNGCGPGKTVGIAGLGGLGHFGVLWAKAMGADKVYVLSRGEKKREDAMALGADEYIATGEAGGNWVGENRGKLDILLNTVSSSKVPMADYLSLMRVDGVLIQLGAPDDGEFSVPAMPLVLRNVRIEGSLIGSPRDIKGMLKLAADHKVKPWVQTRPMKDANQALLDMAANKARYRFVLVN